MNRSLKLVERYAKMIQRHASSLEFAFDFSSLLNAAESFCDTLESNPAFKDYRARDLARFAVSQCFPSTLAIDELGRQDVAKILKLPPRIYNQMNYSRQRMHLFPPVNVKPERTVWYMRQY